MLLVSVQWQNEMFIQLLHWQDLISSSIESLLLSNAMYDHTSPTVVVQVLFFVQPLSSFQTDGNLEATTNPTHQYQEVYI